MHIIYVYIERERERVCISQRGRDWSVGKKPPFALAFVVDAPHTTAETLDHRSFKKRKRFPPEKRKIISSCFCWQRSIMAETKMTFPWTEFVKTLPPMYAPRHIDRIAVALCFLAAVHQSKWTKSHQCRFLT